MAYTGAVVGAGFASGQEIYQFFSRHGGMGLVGLSFSGTGFAVLGALALLAGRDGADDFDRLLGSLYPSAVARLFGLAATLLLGLGLVVVTAAAGQAIETLSGLPPGVPGLASLVAMVLVARRGASGVMQANAVLVPLLLAIAVAVAVSSPGRLVGPGVPGWWLSAGLYVSYNLFTGLVVLLGLGSGLGSRREAWAAAILGAALLTGTAVALHRAVMAVGLAGPFPLLEAARRLGGWWPWLYGAALYAALFTTGVSEAFALSARFGRRTWWALLAWPASWMGFGPLVAGLYPLLGLAAIAFWVPLLRWVPGARHGTRI